MELKRILARDTRSATEQAMALYGKDVLIISNHRVSGQTELVIALEVETVEMEASEDELMSMQDTVEMTSIEETPLKVAETKAKDSAGFDDHLANALLGPLRAAAMNTDAQAMPAMTLAEQTRENKRGKEIVSLVIEELSALRQEIRMNQQVSAWETQQQWPEYLQELVNNLCEAPVPSALRTLLLSGLKEQKNLSDARLSLQQQLLCNLKSKSQTFILSGVHAVAGSSGAGKTLMTLRWAQHAARLMGSHKVAVVSFQDDRAGAWSQIQQLSAQAEVDCYRAANADSLGQLLKELSSRQLVLIDTSGVQMTDRLAEILAIDRDCQLHAVLPVDASSVTLKRVLTDSGLAWNSLMLTKFDESSAPWPLIQFLNNDQTNLTLSMGSESDKLSAGVLPLSTEVLVNLAVAKCMPEFKPTETTKIPAPTSNILNLSNIDLNMIRPARQQASSPILVTHG
jgi:flagellar biosynthesis protein FlhF